MRTGISSAQEYARSQLPLLMDQYEKDVFKVCFLYLQDLSLAEDAVQETFLKAFKGLNAFRGDCHEKTWLMRIAINTCKDIHRGSWFRNVDRRVALESLPASAVVPQTDSILITLEVMALPPKEKEAILLCCYQKMSVTEVALLLGISCAAVTQRIKRAQSKLKMIWKEDSGDAY